MSKQEFDLEQRIQRHKTLQLRNYMYLEDGRTLVVCQQVPIDMNSESRIYGEHYFYDPSIGQNLQKMNVSVQSKNNE